MRLETTKAYSYQMVTVSTYPSLTMTLCKFHLALMVSLTYIYIYISTTHQLNKDVSNPEILDHQRALFHKIGFAMGACTIYKFISY